MVSFLQLAAEKKILFLVQLKQIFSPSYFDKAFFMIGVMCDTKFLTNGLTLCSKKEILGVESRDFSQAE